MRLRVPAVRSIRIATTLNDRFGTIIREAATNQTVAEFELKIGEAQQIYPEIWRHLDTADVFDELDCLRHESRPTPPIELPELDP